MAETKTGYGVVMTCKEYGDKYLLGPSKRDTFSFGQDPMYALAFVEAVPLVDAFARAFMFRDRYPATEWNIDVVELIETTEPETFKRIPVADAEMFALISECHTIYVENAINRGFSSTFKIGNVVNMGDV
jgi:hypothetical protein